MWVKRGREYIAYILWARGCVKVTVITVGCSEGEYIGTTVWGLVGGLISLLTVGCSKGESI